MPHSVYQFSAHLLGSQHWLELQKQLGLGLHQLLSSRKKYFHPIPHKRANYKPEIALWLFSIFASKKKLPQLVNFTSLGPVQRHNHSDLWCLKPWRKFTAGIRPRVPDLRVKRRNYRTEKCRTMAATLAVLRPALRVWKSSCSCLVVF